MSKNSPGKPRHEQVSDWLRDQIEQGVLAENTKLPSESALGSRFGVSRITVRRALQTLESENLIFRRQGLGSFVQDRQVRQGLVRLTDFVEDMQIAGLDPSSRVIHNTPEEAPAHVARHLGVEPGTRVLRLDRLRLGDGDPIAMDRTWLPMTYAALLSPHDLESDTIFSILEREYNICVCRGRFRMESVNAPNDIAQFIDVPWGRALLLIERTSYMAGDLPLYFQQRWYRSDRVAYEIELRRHDGRPSKSPLPLREFEPVFKRS